LTVLRDYVDHLLTSTP